MTYYLIAPHKLKHMYIFHVRLEYKRPINVQYSLGSKNNEPSLSERKHDGSMGEVVGL